MEDPLRGSSTSVSVRTGISYRSSVCDVIHNVDNTTLPHDEMRRLLLSFGRLGTSTVKQRLVIPKQFLTMSRDCVWLKQYSGCSAFNIIGKKISDMSRIHCSRFFISPK